MLGQDWPRVRCNSGRRANGGAGPLGHFPLTGGSPNPLNHLGYMPIVLAATGLGLDQAADIGWSAMLHDVGKLHVPDRILLKPGPLSADEWEIMRRHPVWGAEILAQGAVRSFRADLRHRGRPSVIGELRARSDVGRRYTAPRDLGTCPLI